jgi:cell division septation protein DedD
MKGRLALAFVVPAFAAIFAIAIGAGYLMGQTSFRRSVPPPGLTMPSVPSPGTTVQPGSGSPPSPLPGTSPASPADQPGGGESPSSGPAATPAPPGGAQGDIPPIPVPSPSSTGTPPVGGPTAAPPIPGPPLRFHIQVGSFGDRDGAVSLVRQLRDRGYAVTLVEGPPYRVWVGGYLDRTTAERLAANLQAEGFEASLTPR